MFVPAVRRNAVSSDTKGGQTTTSQAASPTRGMSSLSSAAVWAGPQFIFQLPAMMGLRIFYLLCVCGDCRDVFDSERGPIKVPPVIYR
jgi:hypothetical protein